MNKVRGVRGAITVSENQSKQIIEGTILLLEEMLKKNDVITEEIFSIFFTVTPDLDQAFPAKAARRLGLNQVPLLCMTEIPVKGALEKCIRILIQYNTANEQSQVQHIYLKDAIKLRPDLSSDN